jgi:hypothetical protein
MLGHLRERPPPSTAAESTFSIEAEAEADVQERSRRFEAAWPDLRADQHPFYVLLASRPGEYVPFQPDIATALGGPTEAQNALISLTKRMKRNGLGGVSGKRNSGVAVILVDELTVKAAARLPSLTDVAPVKFVPVIVTTVLAKPTVGEKLEIVGAPRLRFRLRLP